LNPLQTFEEGIFGDRELHGVKMIFLLRQTPHVNKNLSSFFFFRVVQDWQEQWQQRPLLVESFVDETRYRGSCYRACGFEQVGLSSPPMPKRPVAW